MRLIIIFVLVGFLQVNAKSGYAQKITLSLHDAPLLTAFDQISLQSGYDFIVTDALIKEARAISIDVKDANLESVLKNIFQHQSLTYVIGDHRVIIRKKEKDLIDEVKDYFMGEEAEAPQQRIVQGTIVDSLGKPLKGVSIQIKKTNLKTFSDSDGKFSTIVPPDHETLIFSFLGMQKQEINVNGTERNLHVVMKISEEVLEDVVVTGYNNIRKESFTGTFTQVTKEELLKVTSNNLISALQVFDPSFRIMQNINMGSNPNVLPEFYIRGQSGFPGVKDLDKIQSGSDVSQFSLKNNPNTPIFIMDGFEITVEKVYDMDINRIKNVTILKDAAATAVYGSRASNGVVVIETIAPKPGEFRVNYSGNYAITFPDLTSYDMMNAQEKYDAEMAAQVYLPTIPTSDPNYQVTLQNNTWLMQQKQNEILKGVDTYWLSQPLTTMFNNKHSLYVEGGSETVRLGVDLKYDNQNGVMKESLRNRLGFGLTVQYQVKNLQIRNQAYYDDVKADDSPYGSFSDYSRLQPYYNMYTETDHSYVKQFPNYSGNVVLNPLYESTVGNFSKSGYKEWTDNFSINWNINKYLLIKGQFAIDYQDADASKFTSPTSTLYDRLDLFTKGDLSQSVTQTLNWNSNLFASYNRVIGDHNVNFSIGTNALATKDNYMTSQYRGFPSPEYHSPAYAYDIVQKPSFNDNKTRLIGAFTTLNYSFKDLYLFDASARMDGSSEFGTDRKWAPFWSVGTGLNLHKSNWLKDVKAIDLLRVTANVGQTGKSNFSPFMARTTYNMLLDDWYPTGIGANLIYMGNKDLTWEKQVSWNFGADLSLLKRYTFNLNYYRKTTYDLITDVSLPSSSGFTIYRDNVGKVLNKGFEVKATAYIVNDHDFSLVLNGNMAHNQNSILEIAESLKSYNSRIDDYYNQYNSSTNPLFRLAFNEQNSKYAQPIMKYEEGSSLTTIYGMKSLGINPANGKEIFLKRDGTVTYDWNPADQQPIGDTEPWAQGSFGFNARYKEFSLYTSFLYEFGGDMYNQTLVDNVENVNLLYYNADRRVLTDRWQKPGDISSLKAIQDRYYVTRPTSRFLQRNNYISFNSISIGYDVDPVKLRKIKLSQLRFTVLMNDIARIASIRREMGLDYPYAKTVTFTLNASF